MADDTSSASAGLTSLIAHVLMYGVCGLMVVMGIGGQIGVISAYGRGDLGGPQAALVFVFCLFLTVLGLFFVYARHVVEPARERREARLAALDPDAPWMLDANWARRQVVDRSSLAISIFLWIWNAGWWGAIAFIWSVNHEKIVAAVSSSWADAAFGIMFLGCGLIGLACAIGMTAKWWRYGKTTLNIDTLPGYLGNRFRCSIVARLFVDTPLEAEIVCERVSVVWVRTQKGRRRELTTEPVWSHCWPLERDRMMRGKDGTVTIPVDVALPADKPQFALDENGAGVRWMLHMRTDYEAAAKEGRGKAGAPAPDRIDAQFLIPVYARR